MNYTPQLFYPPSKAQPLEGTTLYPLSYVTSRPPMDKVVYPMISAVKNKTPCTWRQKLASAEHFCFLFAHRRDRVSPIVS